MQIAKEHKTTETCFAYDEPIKVEIHHIRFPHVNKDFKDCGNLDCKKFHCIWNHEKIDLADMDYLQNPPQKVQLN